MDISSIPDKHSALYEEALRAISQEHVREEIDAFLKPLYRRVFTHFLRKRQPSSNSRLHELHVLKHALLGGTGDKEDESWNKNKL